MKIACYSLVLGKGYTVPAVVEVLARLGSAIGEAVETGRDLPRQFADTRFILVRDPAPVIERLTKRYGFDELEQDAIWRAFHQEPGKTLFHIINGVTGAANNHSLSLESRQKCQEVGGRILELAAGGTRWID